MAKSREKPRAFIKSLNVSVQWTGAGLYEVTVSAVSSAGKHTYPTKIFHGIPAELLKLIERL